MDDPLVTYIAIENVLFEWAATRFRRVVAKRIVMALGGHWCGVGFGFLAD
jgi:hypothetical protein